MELQSIEHKKIKWLNVTSPDQEMVAFLREEFDFHPLALEDSLSKFQYPKIDDYEDYLFIILQYPIYDKKKQIYRRSEVEIFLGPDYIVTINSGELTSLQTFFESCATDKELRERYMRKGVPLLLYEIIDHLFEEVFPLINRKYETIFQLEEDVFEVQEIRDMVQEIMILKRDLINLLRIVRPMREMLTNLEIKYKKFIPQELDIYFDDITDKIDKMTSQLTTAQSYADVLEDANETIITRNTNRVIKILTIFSVVMLPLTLVTSYYGMNIGLPLQNDPNAIIYINVIMFVLLALMLGFFVRKRWL